MLSNCNNDSCFFLHVNIQHYRYTQTPNPSLLASVHPLSLSPALALTNLPSSLHPSPQFYIMSSLSSTSTTPTLPSPPIPPPVSNVGVSGYVTLVSFGPCRSLCLPSHTSIPLPNPPLLSNFLVDLRIRYPKAVDMLPYIKDDNTNGDAENNKNNNTEEAVNEKVKGQVRRETGCPEEQGDGAERVHSRDVAYNVADDSGRIVT